MRSEGAVAAIAAVDADRRVHSRARPAGTGRADRDRFGRAELGGVDADAACTASGSAAATVSECRGRATLAARAAAARGDRFDDAPVRACGLRPCACARELLHVDSDVGERGPRGRAIADLLTARVGLESGFAVTAVARSLISWAIAASLVESPPARAVASVEIAVESVDSGPSARAASLAIAEALAASAVARVEASEVSAAARLVASPEMAVELAASPDVRSAASAATASMMACADAPPAMRASIALWRSASAARARVASSSMSATAASMLSLTKPIQSRRCIPAWSTLSNLPPVSAARSGRGVTLDTPSKVGTGSPQNHDCSRPAPGSRLHECLSTKSYNSAVIADTAGSLPRCPIRPASAISARRWTSR